MEVLKEKDLRKKLRAELDELLNRQNKLLNSKGFVARLPDKGLKIENTKKQIELEIARREEDVRSAGQDVPLSASLHMSVTETLEWTGEYACDNEELDSDDDSADETDPLKILSSQAGAGTYKKKFRFEKVEKSLITPEDILQLEDDESVDSTVVEPYATRLCHKDETVEKTLRGLYKPYQTVIPRGDVSDSEKRIQTKGPHWEITAATPPHYVHGDVKTITLTESLELLREQTLKLQEVQGRLSADRLAVQIEKLHLMDGRESAGSTSTVDEVLEQEEIELLEDDDTGGGIVVFTVND